MRYSLLLLLLFSINVCAQTKSLKTSVYFDNDKYALRKNDQKVLNVFLDTLHHLNITKITVKGNTDNSADSLYNMKLSQKRTDAVINYIVSKGFEVKLFTAEFFGENKPVITNETEEGKQKNRRVDITVTYFKPLQKKDFIPPPPPLVIPQKKDSCRKDTTIVLKNGIQAVFNLCEFDQLKDCLEFTSSNSASDVVSNGMSLMDTNGVTISSCGMINISLHPGCKGKECFKTAVKVRIPVPPKNECDYCGANARVYVVGQNGDWNQPKGKTEIKTVKVNGISYYQFEVNCPNMWKNCDCKIKGRPVKFKTKKGYKIIAATVSSECPVIVVRVKTNKTNKAKALIPCPRAPLNITATVLSPKGDTLFLQKALLNSLPKRVLFPRCGVDIKEPGIKLLGFIPLRGKSLYRKYYIKTKALKPLQHGDN